MHTFNFKQTAALLLLALAATSALAATQAYSYRVFSRGIKPQVVAATPSVPTSTCSDGQSGCAIWSATDKAVNVQIANGLSVSVSGVCTPGCPSQYGSAHATVSKSSGAYYWEVTIGPSSDGWNRYPCGISPVGGDPNRASGYDQAGGYGFPDASAVSNTTYSCLLNFSTNSLSWKKSGVAMGSVSISAGSYVPTVSMYSTDVYTTNFGQQAFVYAVPSGYTAGVR